MKRGIATLACAAALICLPAAAEEMTLEQVLERHYEAIGGLENWQKIESMRLEGKMTMGPGQEAPFSMVLKRPNKMRIEFEVQGITGVQAFDGETAWMVLPFMGSDEPQKMPEDQTRMMREQADFDGPLVGYGEKGHTVELLGKEDLEGTETWVLKVTLNGGEERRFYLESEAYVPIKQTGKVTMQGQELEMETTLGDYKEVEGLMIPHSIESRAKGMPQGQTITVESVMLDAEAPDEAFAMPAAAAAGADPS